MKGYSILISLLLLMLAGFSYGCDCNMMFGLQESNAAFKGKVLSIKRMDSVIIYYEVTLKVDSVLKGEIRSVNVSVVVPCLFDGCCGIEMQTGDVFWIFAYEEDMGYGTGKKLRTDQCWATHKVRQL